MNGSAAGEGTISRSMRIGSSATITCDRAMPKEPRISHIWYTGYCLITF